MKDELICFKGGVAVTREEKNGEKQKGKNILGNIWCRILGVVSLC